MNKTTEAFEAWWADIGEQSLFALNTTTDDDIKILAGIAWEAAIRKARAKQDHIADAGKVIAEPVKQEPVHPDDEAVDRFAVALKAKLAKKRADGRGGWDDKSQCSAEFLNHLLNEHVGKGDPIDVGNLAMMLWNRGERTTVEPVKQSKEEQGYVPLSDDAKSIFIDGFGEVPIDWDKYHGKATPAQPVKQEPVAYPNLQPVINWLENGCDPKEAAKELRIYQEQMKAAPVSAKREWVELTLQELQACCGGELSHGVSVHAVIAAFKEKNK